MERKFPVVAARDTECYNEMKAQFEKGVRNVVLFPAKTQDPATMGLTEAQFKETCQKHPHWTLVFTVEGIGTTTPILTYIGNVGEKGGKVWEVQEEREEYRYAHNISNWMEKGQAANAGAWIKNLRVAGDGYHWLECTFSEPVEVKEEGIVHRTTEIVNAKIKEEAVDPSTWQFSGAIKEILKDPMHNLTIASLAFTIKDALVLGVKGGHKAYKVGKPAVKKGLRVSGKGLSGLGAWLHKLGG